MKHLLLTTIATVLLVGCGESQQSAPAPETKPVEPVAGAKAPDISIREAAESGNIEAVRQHIAAGTDVNAKDDDEWTPLWYAAANGHMEIVSLLRKHGGTMYNLEGWEKPEAKPVESVAEAAKTDQSPVKTPNISIHAAVRTKNIVAVKQHLAAGTDVNVKDKVGGTPLHRAAWEGHKEVARATQIHPQG